MSTMRPIRALATTLLVGSVALAGCGGHPTTPSRPAAAPPTVAAPTTTPPSPPTQPNATKPTPPSTAEAVATAVAFMRREVGMADPVAGAFRWTGARTGQVDVSARIPGDANPTRRPVATVSLQRLSTVWYVLGVRSDSIRLVVPQPLDAIRSPLGIIAVANDRVRVRITQDRYGPDLELGSAYLSPEPAPKLAGTIAFARPSATTGSVVLTTTSGRNGQVWAATVVRVRLATGQPPQVLGIRLSPQLPRTDGVPQLPDRAGTLTIRVTASHADRARLVYTPTGTETAWYAKVVSQDTTAGDGLRLVWHYGRFDALGNVMVVVVGPGGVATSDLFGAV
ncbi:MAG TPA: hypothetical protein VFA46_00790 [Actinomycetes bacterium]|jgi:hypothetical protein|nr:hypothetical protein [Actinomycetes bacterium]